jgi:hypothetical protein
MTEMTRERVEHLLDEIDEEIETAGYVGLYDFSWTLRGLEPKVDEGQVRETARLAYAEFVRSRPTRLVWLTWPPDPAHAVDADPETVELDFDLDPEQATDVPFLALVPA